METGKAVLQRKWEMHNECLGWDGSSKAHCDQMTDVRQGRIACLAEGRVEVAVPPKTLNALLGTLDRFESERGHKDYPKVFG